MDRGLSRVASSVPVSRRRILTVAAAGGLVAATGSWRAVAARAATVAGSAPRLAVDPFALGVASGDPGADGVVLWTRLTQDPAAVAGGMPPVDVPVRWMVARDEGMRRIVAGGRVAATPEAAHSVRVVVEGLEPDRPYWYRFVVGDHETPVARTRTFPAANRRADRLDFAVTSCQNYRDGYYNAWADVAADEDLDAVLFLGDYIYESGEGMGAVRAHPIAEVVTLDEYRARYALYRGDANLQAAHAVAPWLVVWDDHEVDNNYQGTSPEVGSPTSDPAAFLARRAAAYRAWWEHMPTRLAPPTGPDLPIHRRADFGRLARFHLLDTRQYRSNQPCAPANDVGPVCAEARGPDLTVLGDAQERWLDAGLRSSGASWDLLGQQVTFSQLAFSPGPDGVRNLDQWDGYPDARRRMIDAWRRAGIKNPVVLTGDIHANIVGDVTADFDDPQAPHVGTELVGTSISSSAPAVLQQVLTDVVGRSPHLRWADATARGWLRATVTPEVLQADYRTVDDNRVEGSPLRTARSFVVESGGSVTEA